MRGLTTAPAKIMRFHIGAVPKPESSEPQPGIWTPLRFDFGPRLVQLFAIPLGGIVFVIVGWLWIHFTPVMKNLNGVNPNVLVVELIAAMLVLFPIHELVHAFMHPDFGLSRKTVLGVWPSRLVCYAHYDAPRTRERLLACLAMPFLVITLLPLLIGIVTGHASILVAFVSSLNALGAGIDIFGIILLFWQVPRHANVFNQGWRTYWSQTISG
jgi:sterol desaturase/sphingolipid hydroxylase (fatty acid hydroxylase superfamily)